ncbi:Hypp7401 [Branchiostoma lanceolatum]|uniref:Hypp7401 protein n=1 Tax=Branchiostoma lanceolatum TaxID=7740 RepID=A0A8K0EDW8_BRALA|nr:Hypp7401 [Branchiostoma lanceolatum]
MMRTPKPVAIHHNPKGKNESIACVIENSLGDGCTGMGFASLVLQTIDDITTCLVYLTQSGAMGELVDFRFADMENKVTEYFQPITAETRALVNHVISGYLQPAARVKNTVDTFYQSSMANSVNIVFAEISKRRFKAKVYLLALPRLLALLPALAGRELCGDLALPETARPIPRSTCFGDVTLARLAGPDRAEDDVL